MVRLAALYQVLFLLMFFLVLSCTDGHDPSHFNTHEDTLFSQEYSIQYHGAAGAHLLNLACDRNGNIKVLGDGALWQPGEASMLRPGRLVADRTYRTSKNKRVSALAIHDGQFVFADDKSIFSQAWAGSLFIKHALDPPIALCHHDGAWSLIHNDQVATLSKEALWNIDTLPNTIGGIHTSKDGRWVWTANAIYRWLDNQWIQMISMDSVDCRDVWVESDTLWVGTSRGVHLYDGEGRLLHAMDRLPSLNILDLCRIDGRLWAGTTQGAFSIKNNKIDYYLGRRWLENDTIHKIAKGAANDVLLLSKTGLSIVKTREWTLAEKAVYFEAQVRQRHIRNGFNATLSALEGGDVYTGYLSDSDNDGLWTGMYLGGQAFRYAATGSPEALLNCREAMSAIQRLYDINPVPGFPSRSFERSGYTEVLADPHRWRDSDDPEWSWKATTSSDEAIGHIFAFGVVAEVVDDAELKEQAIQLIDTLMAHIVLNDLYLIDADGQPTTWGRWNPAYVNSLPTMVGDRKLNSSNITAMLQTAYHFTGKEKYRIKIEELFTQHGYLENLMRPMTDIGRAPDSADDWSKMLSEDWNHSDDEMYYMGYWGLYRYPVHDSLRSMYKHAIEDHWQKLRPAKEGAWNIFMGILSDDPYDLEEAIWYLQEYPLDLRTWTVSNSHRHDIEILPPNFIEQTTAVVLPPDELPIARHNANRFRLDGGNGGKNEYSAGDIWLLPYWMAVYLNRIKPSSL